MKAFEAAPKAPALAPAKAASRAPPKRVESTARAHDVSDELGVRWLIDGVDGRGAVQRLVDTGYQDLVQASRASDPGQRRHESAAPAVQARAAQGVSGSGGDLPHRETIQAAFGRHDVGNVKAYVGGQAADAAADLGAMAYTTGERVAFAGSPDLHTAAHEAAHVVQQRGGVSLKDGVGRSGDAYERHADVVADRVVAGQSAEPLLDEASPRRASVPAAHASHEALAVQREPSGQKANDDPDASVKLGILDDETFGLMAEQVLGTTAWTVVRETLRGVVGGFRSMPAAQRARIQAKFDNFGIQDFVQFQEGYWIGIGIGFLDGLKGFGEALLTLVTLPYELYKFVFETIPELSAKYGPRILVLMQEAGNYSSQLSEILSDPDLVRELVSSLEGWALPKIRSIGHGIADKIIGLIAESWFDYGRDVGQVAGRAAFEVLLALATEMIGNLIKEAALWIGRLSARVAEGAVEVFRALRRLLGDALALLKKLAGRVSGKAAEALEGFGGILGRLGDFLAELGEERAVANTGTGAHAPIPDVKGPTSMEARSVKPPGGGTGPKVEDLYPAKVHPSNGEELRATAVEELERLERKLRRARNQEKGAKKPTREELNNVRDMFEKAASAIEGRELGKKDLIKWLQNQGYAERLGHLEQGKAWLQEAENVGGGIEHTKNKSRSKKGKHEEGQSTKQAQEARAVERRLKGLKDDDDE